MKIYESNTFLHVISFLVPYGDVEKKEILAASKENTVSYWLSVGKVLIVGLGLLMKLLYQTVKFECV